MLMVLVVVVVAVHFVNHHPPVLVEVFTVSQLAAAAALAVQFACFASLDDSYSL